MRALTARLLVRSSKRAIYAGVKSIYFVQLKCWFLSTKKWLSPPCAALSVRSMGRKPAVRFKKFIRLSGYHADSFSLGL